MKAAVALAITTVLASCTGEIGENDTAGKNPGEQMFASTVSPMLRSKCASCHEGAGSGPAFMGDSGEQDDYTAVRSNARIVGGFQAANALLLTKGSHAGVTWWTADQIAAITSWLDAELASFGESGVPDVLAAWAGCMTIENWNDSRMAMWAQKQTDQGAACGGCHADGEYGFFANPTPALMFAQQRTATGIGSFFQVSAAGEMPEVAPAFAKLRSKCSGANLHPACAVDDQYVDYLQRFYELTRAMLEAGICDPPGYVDPNAQPTGP